MRNATKGSWAAIWIDVSRGRMNSREEDFFYESKISHTRGGACRNVSAGLGLRALAAGAAGGAGGYAWASGKLSFSTEHNIDECHNATISALSELRIKVTGDSTDKLIGRVKGVTATNKEVTIDLEPQSLHVTKIDIRVGFWGNETSAS